jgi:hypothetical protein
VRQNATTKHYHRERFVVVPLPPPHNSASRCFRFSRGDLQNRRESRRRTQGRPTPHLLLNKTTFGAWLSPAKLVTGSYPVVCVRTTHQRASVPTSRTSGRPLKHTACSTRFDSSDMCCCCCLRILLACHAQGVPPAAHVVAVRHAASLLLLAGRLRVLALLQQGRIPCVVQQLQVLRGGAAHRQGQPHSVSSQHHHCCGRLSHRWCHVHGAHSTRRPRSPR